jgi:hypothetical protein
VLNDHFHYLLYQIRPGCFAVSSRAKGITSEVAEAQ